MALTALQTAFVREYMADPLDGAAAYVRAGGSANRAKQGAYAMLHCPKVMEAIAAAREKLAEKAQETAEDHLRNLADLRDAAKAAAQFGAAITAETNRGKVLGFYTEKHELSGTGGAPLKFEATIRVVRGNSGD